jgi:N-acylneuraminate cytidylyltransferase
MTHARTVAIVPARGGSKSIPRKNIRPLGGIPLIAYSIEAALRARTVDRVIVSTDDEEIAETAMKWGAEVPFMRPRDIAADTTLDFPVFLHAVQWLQVHDAAPDIVVQLRPTSPLRPPDCVDAAVHLLEEDRSADSVRGVVPAGQHPYKMWRIGNDGAMAPLLEYPAGEGYNRPRQELPVVHWQTGHIDAIRATTITDKHSMSGERIRALPIDSAYACDIDTANDWRRVETMLAHFELPIVRPRARRARLPDRVRLIVFDFDGVMTDNRVWLTEGGDELVACSRGDGLGIERVRRLGIQMFVLSTERNPVVGARCRKLCLEYEQGVSDKRAALDELLQRRDIDAASVIYVGNDVNDLECMQMVGCAVAVRDAHPDVLVKADLVLDRPGGHGAVRELCDRVHAHLTSGGVR